MAAMTQIFIHLLQHIN